VLLEWLHSQTRAQMFDLVRERSSFFQTAERLVAEADGQ
jgi:hypothetical protein